MAVDSLQPNSTLGLLKMPFFFSPGEHMRNKKTSQYQVLPHFLLCCFLKTELIVVGHAGLSGTKKGPVTS